MKNFFKTKAARAVFLAAAAALSLLACGKRDCVCTTEMRINYCVTMNGSKEIPDSLVIVRIRKGQTDTLGSHQNPGNCFYEAIGKSSLRVYRGEALLKEVKGIKVKTVDCCHGEAQNIDIAL